MINNAVKYKHKDDKANPIKIISIIEQGSLVIRVEDHGIGIPEDEWDLIFKEAYRSDHAIRNNINGTGLGCFIAGRICDVLGWKISVEESITKKKNNSDHGTTFKIEIPYNQNYLRN